eukprot:CAMPEP_0185038222 /NCGR_PEP_ID=MMETSP1103-20130426/33611_1 /TAXON_ID=36769 /ORGANISM="Paraphysomonas bandaiensis, Strain Caron Lab Isolate" /LENGTH=794 /DNA_ID=CAMNT_0027576553 /DNA_START=86 /DNA_END=2470 /DNA_ORIENTATION=+
MNNKSITKTKSIKTKGIYPADAVLEHIKWHTIRRAGPGMFNHGNTCFLNSVLQCLVHTPPLAQILLQDPRATSGIVRLEGHNAAILIIFKRLVEEVWSPSPGKSISPRGMVNSIRRVARQFRPHRQEDSHEYLRELLNCMHEESLKGHHVKSSDGALAETTVISRVFGGYLCNVLKCCKCKYASRTFNHFQDLSLDVTQGIRSIQDAIASFTKPEKLGNGNEWNCDGCKRKVHAVKQMTISTPPAVLVLHLKRFSFGNMFDKIKKHIAFPPVLDVPTAPADSRTGANTERYDLCGMVVHHGHSVHSGHYVAFVKASNGQWYEMDDSTVSQTSIKTVLKQQAYILFYVKSAPPLSKPPTPPKSRENELATLPNVSNIPPTVSTAQQLKQTQKSRKSDVAHDLGAPVLDGVVGVKRKASLDLLNGHGSKIATSASAAAVYSSSESESVYDSACEESSTNNTSEDDSDFEVRLAKRLSWRIGIFRFKGIIGRLSQWKKRVHRKPLRMSNNAINGKATPVFDHEGLTNRVENNVCSRESPSKYSRNQGAAESSDSSSPSPSPELSRNTHSARQQYTLSSTNKDVRQDLIALSMRGRDTGGEGMWEGDGVVTDDVIKTLESSQKKVRREEQKMLSKRKVSEWDRMLDSGRQKKVKKKEEKQNVDDDVNHFQSFQDKLAAGEDFQGRSADTPNGQRGVYSDDDNEGTGENLDDYDVSSGRGQRRSHGQQFGRHGRGGGRGGIKEWGRGGGFRGGKGGHGRSSNGGGGSWRGGSGGRVGGRGRGKVTGRDSGARRGRGGRF